MTDQDDLKDASLPCGGDNGYCGWCGTCQEHYQRQRDTDEGDED